MNKYKITINFETEIEAMDEEEALENFWNYEVEEPQSDARSFIDCNLKIKEIK